DSVLGMEKDEPLRRFLSKIPSARFAPAVGAATLSGVVVDVDDRSGLATAIVPIRIGGHLEERLPYPAG
ncbi:MAG TPA: YmdB family metallophosphoesterase, partial [Hyphomicrobiales bacterium]|nr:YmdB family metallophosphoesterase [Hyphomicrobiales bacterium]